MHDKLRPMKDVHDKLQTRLASTNRHMLFGPVLSPRRAEGG